MIIDTLAEAIKTKIETDFTEVSERVYIIDNSTAGMPNMYSTPFVWIHFAGGEPNVQKSKERINHLFYNIYIIQSIYNEEATIEGDVVTNGLLKSNRTLYGILKDERFTVALPGSIINVEIVEVFGVESLEEVGSKGYGASIGFKIRYTECES